MRRGHHPLKPIMSALALRCSNLRLWSSHQASPSSPHFLARLASRIPPLFSSPGLLSLPVPLTLPHFCSCVFCVSLCSGFTIGFPAPQSRARPGHDCSIFSTRLAVPSLRHGAATSIPSSQRSEVPIKESHCLGCSACSCRPPSCVLPAPETKCYAKSKCRLSTATIMPIAVAAQDISPQGGGLSTTQTHQPANQRKAVACRTHFRLGT